MPAPVAGRAPIGPSAGLMGSSETALALTLSARQASAFELLANGGFAPLEGFMGSDDWASVCERMRLASGEIWPIPITLASALAASAGDVVELSAPNGKRLGTLTVDEVFERDAEKEADLVYLTTDDAHPGVAAIYAEGNRCLAGPIEAEALPDHDEAFMRRYLTPEESRQAFAERGWKRVVAFQTRNPIHRAHEYLTKAALEVSDGLFLHPLIGETKAGDIPADVRMRCYEILMERYYPNGRVILGVNPAKMHYAGPREAVLHAIIRRNYGATHFIVGRDHAGVGDYYGTYDAQRIFDDIDFGELGIEPLFFEHTFWCHECEGMASDKTCPHAADSRLILSGTKVREMLSEGEVPPHEFTRKEVAEILIDAYRKESQ
jgi:sulfate adenylyltransferase